MIKEIEYNGYSAQPSDYECNDGTLCASLNLIAEDNQIKTIGQPVVVLGLQNGERVLFVHNVPGKKNYILARECDDNSFEIFWLDSSVKNTDNAKFIATMNGLLDIAAIGNTLVFALEEGLKYVLWKDDDYIPLRNKPPFISIDFGMCRVGTLTDSGKHTIPARCAVGWDGQRGQAVKSELASMTEMVYGLLNPAIAEKVTSQGLFYQPFFVRYAYRLYDGTYSWHSAPILMLPTVTPPIVKYTDDGSHPAADGTLTATFQLNVNYFALAYRILTDGIEELADWADLVSGIDVFISAPIYTYDQAKDLTWRPVTDICSMLLSLYDWNPDNLDLRGGNATVPSSVFVGHYADSLMEKYIDHTMSTAGDDNYNIINIKQHERFHNNIRNAHDFYKVAEIDIKDIKAMSSMSRLKLMNSNLSSLVTLETMPDDYQSHCNIVASSLYTFNSRLNLAGVKIAPAEPFTLRSCTQFSNPDGLAATSVRITVWTRLNGVRCYAVHTGKDSIEADIFYNSAGNFPRYIFYPDASAYKMEIFIAENQKFIINLTPHDFLNGAYYYSADFGPDTTPKNAEPETAESVTSVSVGSKIYTSEINNPFTFPLLGINTIGSGDIMGICSAAKALSQGQFGQFPLYAFTTEGVWAMEVSAQGTYSAKQPITRDVCINPDSITQIDSAVLFATDRGIMLISGSQTQCISDSLNSDTPFDVLSLPGMDKLHEMLGHGNDSCFPIAPFSEFLSSCGIIYDYVHQRIFVFSPKYSYAYVYSLKSKQWGMVYSNLIKAVNSYPEALAIDSSGNLIDFSKESEEMMSGLIVTRPIKLGEADILKTVDTVIQRGYFRSGHVKSVLYGSRDLFNWHLINSSVSHHIVNRLGTPYKYFRVALLCSLDKAESVYGCTVQYIPRFTNRPR